MILEAILILFSFIVLMLYFYTQIKRLLPIIAIYLFSIIIGMYSMSLIDFPFTPMFQLFFILFQSILFYMSVINGYDF